MGTCYIIGAGEFYGELKPARGDLIIAADGGLDTLLSLGITPDLIIGDMDSTAAAGAFAEVERIFFPVKKDETDTHLAYLEGAKRGYSDFRIYGGVGGREDHTFANLSLLIYGKMLGHNLTLVGNGCEWLALFNEEKRIYGKPSDGFSVFAFGGEARGVSIKGALYEAEDITLSPYFSLGVSNSFSSEEVALSVREGALLVMREKGARR